MRTVSSIVSTIVNADEIASESLRRGILNLSAYADTIHEEVETLAWKSVQRGTIVVSLARIAHDSLPVLRPTVLIEDLKIKSPLCDISYEKTESNMLAMQTLREKLTLGPRAVFTMTEGMGEITLIASASLLPDIRKHFATPEKSLYTDVVGISVGFPKRYLEVPNTIYSLLSAVACRQINIIEVISTYTEIMFVVTNDDQKSCVLALEQFFPKTTS